MKYLKAYHTFERYQMIDKLNLSDCEDQLLEIESIFKSMPKLDIFDCVMELSDLGVKIYDEMVHPCIWKGEELIQSKSLNSQNEWFNYYKTRDFHSSLGFFDKKNTIRIVNAEQIESIFRIKSDQEIEQILSSEVVTRTFSKMVRDEVKEFGELISKGWMPCFAVLKLKQLSHTSLISRNVTDVLQDIREKVFNLYGYEMVLFPSDNEPSIVFIDKEFILTS